MGAGVAVGGTSVGKGIEVGTLTIVTGIGVLVGVGAGTAVGVGVGTLVNTALILTVASRLTGTAVGVGLVSPPQAVDSSRAINNRLNQIFMA